MQRWEYKWEYKYIYIQVKRVKGLTDIHFPFMEVIAVDGIPLKKPVAATAYFAELGADGWELVSYEGRYMIFKRVAL